MPRPIIPGDRHALNKRIVEALLLDRERHVIRAPDDVHQVADLERVADDVDVAGIFVGQRRARLIPH